MRCETCLLCSAWKYAIGDEYGLVRLQAHVIKLHNVTKFLQGSLQGTYLQVGWTAMSG